MQIKRDIKIHGKCYYNYVIIVHVCENQIACRYYGICLASQTIKTIGHSGVENKVEK